MTAGRTMPWLQDTAAENARQKFGAFYRDVIILDGLNREVGRYNLTTFDLALPNNTEDLKRLLRDAAALVDSDSDGVADDWEERYLGGLGQTPGGDLDRDGDDNMIEYGLATDPGDSTSHAGINYNLSEAGGTKEISFSFRRRLGEAGGLQYLLESSTDGENWDDASGAFSLESVENPYDGTGTEIVTYKSTGALGGNLLFRVRVIKQ